MGMFENALIYATKKHDGKVRKATGIPAILHSIEVAHIISTLTTDTEVMVAGLLHDVVEDTDGTLDEIREQFGDRVADIVDLETENKYEGIDKGATWKKRKEESIKRLHEANSREAEILWLADKLSNIRSLASAYSEKGSEIWEMFNQKDPNMHLWYYKTIAEILEMHLNTTGAFKEYVKHINSIWPETFAKDKEKYKKYKEVSLAGCKIIGVGAKGEVYRYNDETVIKLYNENTEYKDIEREQTIARAAFIAGIPTAISFGIIKVGNRYGSMFELLESKSITSLIADNPRNVKLYAKMMADLAKSIHSTSADKVNIKLPNYIDVVRTWVSDGIAYEDEDATKKISDMIDALPDNNTLIHGDFHTGNVMYHRGECLLIDMDRLSVSHPIVELCGAYMFYVGFWEVEKPIVDRYMTFSIETGREFFYEFMKEYLGSEDTQDVINKAALLSYVRLIRKCYIEGRNLTDDVRQTKDYYMDRIRELLKTVDSLSF